MKHVLVMMPTWSAPSERWLWRLTDGLAELVGALACYEAPARSRRGPAGEVPVIDLGRRDDPTSLRRGVEQVRGFLQADQRRVLLAHYLTFAMRYTAAWDGLPNRVFVHAHGYDLTESLHRQDAAGRWVRFHPADYPARVVGLAGRLGGGAILANSHRSRDKLLAMGVPAERVVVNYLGVEVPEAPPRRRLRPGGVRLLYLGRLVDFKGPGETVEAFVRAVRRGLRAELTVAGDGDRTLLPASLPAGVRWLGAVGGPHADLLRATHDLFVSHSQCGPRTRQEEALGVAYLEAMSAGMPVVSAWGGSLAEVVEDGVSGFLVAPGDLDAQAQRLLELSRDESLYRRLSVGAWHAARERFSHRQTLQRLRELLIGNVA